jgi:hypothetical protein
MSCVQSSQGPDGSSAHDHCLTLPHVVVMWEMRIREMERVEEMERKKREVVTSAW